MMATYRLSQFIDDCTFTIHKIDNGHEKLVAEFGVKDMPIMIDRFKDSPNLSERLKVISQFFWLKEQPA